MAPLRLKVAETPRATPAARADTPALLIGRLYEQHYRMVRALCQLLLNDPADAEDAAQQTFLSAFGSMIGGTVPTAPAPWLATIARRECWARSAQRRQRPLSLDDGEELAAADANPLEDAIRNADLGALWAAINGLPRQQRSAFLMREFAGLSYAEVAHALGATESAIESLLVRARRHVRDGLESAVGTANLLATPILLLQHRLARLLGGRGVASAGATASAGIPVAAKLGAVAASAIAVGTAGVGAGIGTAAFGHGHAARPASSALVITAGTGTSWSRALPTGRGAGRRSVGGGAAASGSLTGAGRNGDSSAGAAGAATDTQSSGNEPTEPAAAGTSGTSGTQPVGAATGDATSPESSPAGSAGEQGAVTQPQTDPSPADTTTVDPSSGVQGPADTPSATTPAGDTPSDGTDSTDAVATDANP